ncbi:MAG: methionyl-tRNA formyltransferase [Gammaproteobacteria bacterium]|nr:methionyl-tRNA formyltransferase [Gammaproteobacteria bacterium]MYF62226.1 methionyl-tRNA formyltransferase [Gammaproteobacteria bacterium]MYI21380.1 methionyl-tRNA formyltransferase [Gammaproteobacteria bacterium]
MRIIVNGQQAFGAAVLKALVERGEDIVGVYTRPEKPGQRPDPLADAAREHGLPLFQPSSFRNEDTWAQMKSLRPDLGVMAYVTLFVPEQALDIPTHGTIQYHPSLLPLHRGPSSINWPIIWGRKKTGLSIFWPDDGLDEGPILLQKEVDIGDHTLGSLYFNHLFPMGVDAMLEGVDMVRAGKAPKIAQDHSAATYEGWCKHEHVRVSWNLPLRRTWNLVRGADPQPGAWSTFNGAWVKLYGASRIDEALSMRPGQVTGVGPEGVRVAAPDGQLLIAKVRPEGGKKMAAGEWAESVGLARGVFFI